MTSESEPTAVTFKDEPRLEEPADITSEEGRGRSWSFWSRGKASSPRKEVINDELQSPDRKTSNGDTIMSTTSNGILSNVYLPFQSKTDNEAEATLFQETTNKSTQDQIETEQNLKELGQNPNIVVPQFEILPESSKWNHWRNKVKEYAASWNLVNKEKDRRHTLERTSPQPHFDNFSENGKVPIKVLIVGVHGFFPTKLIRPFIGEPTGTSTKFVLEAEAIVMQYFEEHNQTVEISKIALEKEGKIFERVDYFFDVMSQWSKDINQADIIYFISHSQGCPVTIILLAKLLECGIINIDNSNFFDGSASFTFTAKRKVISVLGMAGINNGPFYGADQTLFVRAYQTLEKDSLRELFEFQKFDSLQSKQFIESLRTLIRNDVKITFVGSINDQLVPLYSSICLFAHHPNIFRATFVDRGSQTPAFITRIIKLAGSLIDLGYDDHSIIKEISGSLAGPLTGGGHSTIYKEVQVYQLGLRFALETTSNYSNLPVDYTPYQLADLGANTYHLPWCMRGLLYETGKHLGQEEIESLFQEFEEWEPSTKQLKDIKYRLNGIRYRL
ncbi:hypothetical protein RNJ44_02860 [Nakaseomyces bracarensis]|uniref:YMC020W-like alpha/beta hydrolase domain-containing protein n=1 Tax=Nakaseomyces bracarensis TaxID=273131 RepID=A0ABR4P0F4_9SACH